MIEYIPSKAEKLKLKKEVDSFLRKFKCLDGVKFTLGGSYAKGTWLPGNRDVDIFVKFNYKKFKDEDISLLLYKILKKKFKNVLVVHGSRDYFHIMVNDILFEVVPVLDIRKASMAKNVMDVSPLHVNYVKSKVSKKNDVRKLKLLMKANNLYGAESYISGFSGYVLEVLVSYYGSFGKLISKVSSWGDSSFIDVSRAYSSKSIGLKSLNKSKLGSLVLIDPVDSSRNAAASVSVSKFRKFVSLCKNFSLDSFTPVKVDVSKLPKSYVVLDVVPLSGKRDISLSKMRALLDRIVRSFTYNGFKVLDYGWDESHYWFKVRKLSSTYRHYGPSLKMEEHVKAFKKKYGSRKVKVSRGRCYVVLKRKYVKPEDFLKHIIKQKFVKEKVKKISF